MMPIRCAALLVLLALPACALEREAFSVSSYDLRVELDPLHQGLVVNGKATLRNDSAAPQRNLVLQISSSMEWLTLRAGGKRVQYLVHPISSDVDHTGGLTEAVVTLPAAVAPRGTVDLDFGYAGTVEAGSKRMERVGAPKPLIAASEWDRITPEFTGVRGAGFVAWYPVAIEPASMSAGEEFAAALDRWQSREAASSMHLRFCTVDVSSPGQRIANGTAAAGEMDAFSQKRCSDFDYAPLGRITPTIASASYGTIETTAATVLYLNAAQPDLHRNAADDYARVAVRIQPMVESWLGPMRRKVTLVEIPSFDSAPYESGAMLFLPLKPTESKTLEVTLAHIMAHAAFPSPRPWIEEGLAHFAEARMRELQDGRAAALGYMEERLELVRKAEAPPGAEPSTSKPGTPAAPAVFSDAARSLLAGSNELFYRYKAMYVWWMLRDMLGENTFQSVLAAYKPEQDTPPTYLQKLLERESRRNLETFFDDWVYRDRGLPALRISGAYARPVLGSNGFLVTLSVENRGNAGAEVPVTVRTAGGDVNRRIEVPALAAAAALRIDVPATPTEVILNDGSVPEQKSRSHQARVEMPSRD